MEETQISVKENSTEHGNRLKISRSQKSSLASLKMTFAITRWGPSGWTSPTPWVWRLNPFRPWTISCAKQWALYLRGQLGEPKLRKTIYYMEKTALQRQFILNGENHILLENHFHVNKLMTKQWESSEEYTKKWKEAKKVCF